jgi:hypothetical protein
VERSRERMVRGVGWWVRAWAAAAPMVPWPRMMVWKEELTQRRRGAK